MFFKLRGKSKEVTNSQSKDVASENLENHLPRLDQITPALVFDALGNLSDFQDRTSNLKIWLPKAVADLLGLMSKKEHSSVSKALRQLLFTHCYGVYAFTCALQQHRDIFDDWDSGALFSRAQAAPLPPGKKRIRLFSVPELGKNIVGIKLHLPKIMVDDLHKLSGFAGLSTSQYTRETIISRLLGHGTLPRREDIFDASPSLSADAWANGETVNWIDMARDNILDFQEYKFRTEIIECDANDDE